MAVLARRRHDSDDGRADQLVVRCAAEPEGIRAGGDRRRTSTASLRHRERHLRAVNGRAHEARARLSDHLRYRLPLFRFWPGRRPAEARTVGWKSRCHWPWECDAANAPVEVDLKQQTLDVRSSLNNGDSPKRRLRQLCAQYRKWGQNENRTFNLVGQYKLRGRKRRVSNRNLCSQSAAYCRHLSIKLFCERLNHAGTKPGFRLSEHTIRLTGAIVGDRKLPICS